ncbi:NUDIX hydrolase [Microbacterium sp. JZ31]|uniref:NUDIX hydrolase n=1 Tax=Microbacterium sp. JZ31 TaxID=1906274 RepID=UPI0019332DD1|nr:NUDIX domain-containing protein [Microbacterium sp. JZ31]
MAVITVAAIAFVRDDGRVLTVRKRGTSRWMLPGGKPEPGEQPVDTAVREVHEELGIRIAPEELELLGAFDSHAANEAGHALRATVFVSRSAVEPVVQAEIDGLRWSDPDSPDDAEAPLNRDVVFPLLRSHRGLPRRGSVR